jgi:cytosine/adenosine deaminase-related metal-dependent hydrolase
MFNRFAAVVCVVFCSCLLFAQNSGHFKLRGTVLSADGKAMEDGVIEIQGDAIAGIRTSSADSASTETQSYILPGFIDLHNHITWNVFPRWRTYVLYANRYEWQQRADYQIALDTPHRLLVEQHDECAANEYAEIKALVGGATSTVGSMNNPACIQGLVRNLDFDPEIAGRKVNNEVFPLTLSPDRASEILSDLAKSPPVPFLAHIAEGKSNDAASKREFIAFSHDGFLRPGSSIIHGVALKRPEFEQMASAGVGLIWSPRSNIELYGETADIEAAKSAEGEDHRRITIALAPDWSPSGSDGVLQELKYAAIWNAGQGSIFTSQELVSMATANAAKLAGLADKVGAIAPGMLADLVLIRRHSGATPTDGFNAIVHSGPEDIRLVVVGGIPLYGDADLMTALHPGKTLESLSICGTSKSLYIPPLNAAGYPRPWKEVSERLTRDLHEFGTALAPLTACTATNLN